MSDYHRNKHVLGELTIGDLMDMGVVMEEFSLGVNWLPISRILSHKNGSSIGLVMDSLDDEPDVEISLDAKVKVEGMVVRVLFKPSDPRISQVRIRLEKEVFR